MNITPADPTWMPASWEDEVALIKVAADRAGVQWEFVAAVRKAENGAHPYNAFGVLSLPLGLRDSYAKQLQVVCASAVSRLIEFDTDGCVTFGYTLPNHQRRLVYSPDFFEYFASKWAPLGANNDPTGMNDAWLRNATAAYYRFVDQG